MRICNDCDAGIIDARAKYCSTCGSRLGLASGVNWNAESVTPPVADADTVWFTAIRHSTVLFVDLVRSTEMIAGLDAEGVMNRLRPILDTMCRIVEESGGVVLSTAGDGVVALFGAIRVEERHAELACHAAFSIREAIKVPDANLAIRAGLHSGEVVVHYRVSDPEDTVTAYGVMLHLASRLPGVIDPDQICLTETCRSLSRQVCSSHHLGTRLLQGVLQTTGLYLLDGMTDRSGWQSSVDGSAPFLGRQKEMQCLQKTLDRALDGKAEAICVVGAPGTGKTRLCREFARLCDERDIPVFQAGIQPYGAMSPIRSLGLLLKEACFSSPGTVITGAVVASTLISVDAGSPGDLALVCNLLGMPAAGKPDILTTQARNTRFLEIIRRLFARPEIKPRVLVVEDVHWIDGPGRLLLIGLARAVFGTNTMLVLNCRPIEAASWLDELGHTLRLDDLSSADTCLLVESLLGLDAELDGVRAQIVARSAGNPFFAEEIVRSLVDDGTVVGLAGAYIAGDLGRLSMLPLTVQAVIETRIDHLSRQERDLVQLCAAVGKEFHAGVLQTVLQNRSVDVGAILERLRLAGIVQLRNDADDGQYEFRHPLIQEVAYSMQLRERRSRLHAKVARALQELYPDCDGDMAQVIAVHLERAGQLEEAATYTAQAARWSGQHSSAAAIERWHKVLTLLGQVADPGDNGALGIEANGQVAWLGWREGHKIEQAEPFLQEALAGAIRSGHPMTSLLMSVRGRMKQVTGGDSDDFVRTLLEAIALSRAQGDTGRVATLQASLSHAYGWAGLLNHALVANDAALADAHLVTHADQQFLGYDVRDWALSLRGRILLRLGMVSPARQCFDLMIDRKESTDPTVAFVGHFGYVELAQFTGDEDMAVEHADYMDALARRHGNAYLTFYAAVTRALANGVAGRLDEAMYHVRLCLDLQQRSGAAMEFEPELRVSLADFQRRAGFFDDAFLTASQAEAMAQSRNARLPQCRAIIVQAETALLIKNPTMDRQQAMTVLDRAVVLMQLTGARLYLPMLKRAQALLGQEGSDGRTNRVNSASP